MLKNTVNKAFLDIVVGYLLPILNIDNYDYGTHSSYLMFDDLHIMWINTDNSVDIFFL